MRQPDGLPSITSTGSLLLLVSLAVSSTLPLTGVAPAFAQSGSFQQIRTFDPVQGLVPGNGPNGKTAPSASSGSSGFSGSGGSARSASPSPPYAAAAPYASAAPYTAPAFPPDSDSIAAPPQARRRPSASIYSGTTDTTGATQNSGPAQIDEDEAPRTPPQRYSNSVPSQTRNRPNSYQSRAQEPEPETVAHHKHHHKFLIFGHHDDTPTEDRRTDMSQGAFDSGNSRASQASARYRAPQMPVVPSVIAPAPASTTIDMSTVIPRPSNAAGVPLPIAPPDPPQRPATPVVDQNLRLPPPAGGTNKPSLAWRARAWRLATEPDDSASLARHPSRILNCSTEEALAAIADCCRSKGGQIIGQSVAAGQLGARFSDAATGRAVLVFIVKPTGNNRTILKASADSDRAQKIALANDLIVQAAAIIDGKGLL
jgi:hypothetical protein